MSFEKREFKDLQEANAWATEKGEELALRFNRKITPIVLTYKQDPFDVVIGFLKNPLRSVKLQALNQISKGDKIFACKLLLEHCLVREESDPRMLSEEEEYDGIYNGCILATMDLIEVVSNDYEELKKN